MTDGQSMTPEMAEFARQASHPEASPEFLADLAQRVPEVRPLIAANPVAYPGLLEWMAQLGDPAVLAAIAARTAAPVTPAAAPRPKRRSVKIIAIIAGALVIVVVGAVVGVTAFISGGFSSATESAKAFPATTYAWSEISIDPSADQKLGALKILGNLPNLIDYIKQNSPDLDYTDPAKAGDIKRALWKFATSDSGPFHDSKLDYDADIKPWLGSRISVGSVGKATLVAIEASNVDAGVKAVQKLVDESIADNTDSKIAVSSHNGYVVVSSSEESFDLTAEYATGTLADTKAMKDASARMGGWGLMSAWFSPHALYASGQLDEKPDAATLAALPPDGSIATVTRFVDSSLESLTVTSNMNLPKFASASGSPLASLPASTMAAVSASQVGSVIDSLTDKNFLSPYVGAFGGDSSSLDDFDQNRDDLYSNLEDQYGVQLPRDFAVIFGKSLTITADADLNCNVTESSECKNPNIGIKIQTDDPAGTESLIKKIIENVNGDPDAIDITTGDGTASVSLGGYGATLLAPTSGGSLGDSAAFKRALPDANGAFLSAYVDAGAVLDQAKKQMNSDDSDTTTLDYLKGISAIGLTATQDGNGDITIRMRVSTGN